MNPSTDWIGGLAPFVLAGVLLVAALVGGKLPPALRSRVAWIGGGVIAVAVIGFGAMLVARGLSEHNPAIWARGLSMVILILVCLGVLAVRARMRAARHDGGAA